MKRQYRILLVEPLDEPAHQALAARAEVVRPASGEPADVRAAVAGCDALIARTHNRISSEILQAADSLKVVGIAGVGLDNVDLAAAERLGIPVLNTPEASSDAVAEFTIALILQLLRPIGHLAARYAAGEFRTLRERPHGPELRGLTLGIVGMGRIGSRVGRIAAAGFAARVLYNDIAPVGPFEFPCQAVDKPTLWREADVVSLHVPATEQTRGLIAADVLGQFKPGAYLVNTARGSIVRTDDLLAALRSGRLAGAALDVVDPEPLPADHPLFAQPNCILTPHVAARTHGGLRRMFAIVDKVLAYLDQLAT